MPMGADQGRSCAINWIKAYVPTSVGEEAFCGKDRQVSPGKVKLVLGGEPAPRWSLPAQGRCPSHGQGHKPPGEGVRMRFRGRSAFKGSLQ